MKNKKRKEQNYDKLGPVITYKPLEVSEKECRGDVNKMIKRFCKKTRKEEVLKPYFGRLMYWETKSQKRRRKNTKSIYEWKKQQLKEIEDDKK